MARRIQPIFDRIFAAFEADDPRLCGQLSFVKSLQESYNRKKSLTPRQKQALIRVEAVLDSPMPTVDSAMETKLTTLVSRAKEAGDTWATEFCESLLFQVRRGKALSKRQEEVLHKVQVRHSDEAVAARKNWHSTFDSEKRQRLQIAAAYYGANHTYFRDLVAKVQSDENFVPTKREYDKLVENKYAKKVIEATLSEPVFGVGQMVALRSSAVLADFTGPTPRHTNPRLKGLKKSLSKGFVVSVAPKPVFSAARGAKLYSVLFFGQTSPVFIEERHLKKAKA